MGNYCPPPRSDPDELDALDDDIITGFIVIDLPKPNSRRSKFFLSFSSSSGRMMFSPVLSYILALFIASTTFSSSYWSTSKSNILMMFNLLWAIKSFPIGIKCGFKIVPCTSCFCIKKRYAISCYMRRFWTSNIFRKWMVIPFS